MSESELRTDDLIVVTENVIDMVLRGMKIHILNSIVTIDDKFQS